ncbi:MAG: DNA primase, partial [Candidatus Aenigmarchaeota archaeon]|nr:DNA primase [Candidatus Aenigmarchaeota archaeon]
MAKLAQNFAKYMIYARMQAKGVVERPDVIGAIFGQTEGLLGNELDLRDLQQTGRVGRIEVNVKTSKGKAFAEIIIPSSLDASETSLIAASLETIDKVGPCDAEVEVTKVDDVRSQKRRYVIDRAKEILHAMMDSTGMPDSQRMADMIKEAVRTWEVGNYNGLACGPDIETNDEIIVVEGRADVINLLKNGIRNVIAIEGSKIPQPVVDLTRKKTTTAFLDGDRGGDLDLKKLMDIAEIDFVARADPGKEVEELTKKEIYKALREKVPASQAADKRLEVQASAPSQSIQSFVQDEPVAELNEDSAQFFTKILEDLVGTRAAYLIDRDQNVMTKVPLSELGEVVNDFAGVYAIAVDGKISQPLVDMAKKRGVEVVAGMGFKERVDAGRV